VSEPERARGQGPAAPRVEVWQQADGAWRWRYLAGDGEERVELPSNEPDPSPAEAVRKASIAYPGLPVEVREPPGGDPEQGREPSGRRRRRVPRAVVRLLVAAVVVLAVAARRRRVRPRRRG